MESSEHFEENDPFAPTDPFEEIERRMNIHRLQNEASELSGGLISGGEAEDLPPEVAEQFWQHVVDFEKAPWTTHLEQLAEDGIDLSAPEDLTDEQLHESLWQAINGLAARRVFLHSTDHLSDRELYEQLWHDALREPVKDISHDKNGAWHIDLLGSGSEEDMFLSLKYYYDEENRAHWQSTFPDYEMPAHEEPPYDRDRLLPEATYEADDGDEFDETDWEWEIEDDEEDDEPGFDGI